MKPAFRKSWAAALGALLLYGCASSGSKPDDSQAPPSNPLAGMAGRQLLILPAQYLAVSNPGGGWDILPGGPALLPILDEELGDTFRRRGVRSNWTFGGDITEIAARNGNLTGNPRQLSVQQIRRVRAGDTPLPEPLAGEIRGLVALTSARFVVLPLELRVDTRNNERAASLRILLIDSRTARVAWAEDIAATQTRDQQVITDTFSPYGFRQLARDIATKFADMVIPQ
ncbi:MAG TPA: hypothetical protein VF042_12495 [Gemmatimonadaceae bacterium]